MIRRKSIDNEKMLVHVVPKRKVKLKIKLKKRKKKNKLRLRGGGGDGGSSVVVVKKMPVVDLEVNNELNEMDKTLKDRYLHPRVLTAPAAVWKRQQKSSSRNVVSPQKNVEEQQHVVNRIDMMLNAFDLQDEDEMNQDQQKWGRRTPNSLQRIHRRPPSRQRGLFPTHLNSSSGFMPPTVPRSMTPRKRNGAEKRILKRTNSSASSRREKKKAVWVSRPGSRHKPPSKSLFLRLPPKNRRKVGISEDRTSSKTRIIWGTQQEGFSSKFTAPTLLRRRPKTSKNRKKKVANIVTEPSSSSKHDESKVSLSRPKSPIKRSSLQSRGKRATVGRAEEGIPKIKRLARRSVVSRRHKSGKVQLLLLTDSEDSEDSSEDEINRRVSDDELECSELADSTTGSTTTPSVSEANHQITNKSSENEEYEDDLETSSLDRGFLALFANRHDRIGE